MDACRAETNDNTRSSSGSGDFPLYSDGVTTHMEETRAARTAQILAPQGRDHVAACRTSTGAPGDMAISAAELMSPPCVGTCVIAISLFADRSRARPRDRARAVVVGVTPRPRQYVVVVRRRIIVYIGGSRFLVGAESEDHAPISHPPPIGPLVTAAQHCDIARERIFLHFEKRRVHPPDALG